jgi:para-nitrobenzyl esterase
MLFRSLISVSMVFFLGCTDSQTSEPAESTEAAALPNTIDASVAVTGGQLLGFVDEDDLKQFHGIPFAAPPIGNLRWAPPAAVVPWEGERAATEPGAACMQPQDDSGSFYGRSGFAMDEDCLFLNVWTRAKTESDKLPVMVWIHGGALVTGSGNIYAGESLTAKGVVLVTVNYRLGRFGFLAHPELTAESAKNASGNQGLRDQIAALQWVQQNIARFGGDPDKVTIFGESAGSFSMSLLQASPLTRGLIDGVIGQSGGAFQPMWFRDKATSYAASAEQDGDTFIQALTADGSEVSLDAARNVPAEQVLEVIQSNPAFSNYDALAIVDGDVIPDEVATIFSEGRQIDVPVLIGSNANEGSTFLEYFTPIFGQGQAGFNGFAAVTLPETVDSIGVHYPSESDQTAEAAWADLFSDVLFAYPMRTWARNMETVESDAYLYFFTWAPPVENTEKYGAFHAGEIGYVFGDVTQFGATPAAADHQLSDMMSSMWTQFAKTGTPNGLGLPQWQAYSSDTEVYMELGVNTGMHSKLRMGQMALIETSWAQRRENSTQ